VADSRCQRVDGVLILRPFELVNDAIFTAEEQSATVGQDAVNACVERRVPHEGQELATHGTDNNVTFGGCNDELNLVFGPAVARVVLRNINAAARFPQLRMDFLEGTHAILKLVVFEGTWTSHDDDLVHDLSIGNLEHAQLKRLDHRKVDLCEHFLLLPLPQNDAPVARAAQCHQVVLLVNWRESTAKEFFALEL